MALDGENNPDTSLISTGTHKDKVEEILGPPVDVVTSGNQEIFIYPFEKGNESSVSRAIGHGVMDIMTLGIWEIYGTPSESIRTKKFIAKVSYNKNNEVESFLVEPVENNIDKAGKRIP